MKAGIFPVSQYKHRLGKRNKYMKTVQGKVVVSDNSLIGSFCVVSILIQINLILLEIPLSSKEKHSQTLHDDEGRDKPHHLPAGRGLKIFFPPRDSHNLPFSMLKCVLMCSCLCCCYASTSATSPVVGPSHGARLCCAEAWLGLGSGCTWCLWGPSQHQGVCTMTNQGSKEATVQT